MQQAYCNFYIALVTFCLCYFPMEAHGQKASITGTVRSTSGELLPFVNIFSITDQSGSASNKDGFFQLSVSEGTHKIAFQYIGYKTIYRRVELAKGDIVNWEITLEPESIVLSEVTIKGERNPADGIMEKVIARRKQLQQLSQQFEASSYMKSTIRLVDAPKKILGQQTGGVDSIFSGMPSNIIYLSETQSLYARYRNKTKEKVIASRVSGIQAFPSINQVKFLDLNLYLNNPTIFERTVKSPIAEDAFQHYSYKLVGTYTDESDRQIYRIQFLPKRKQDPLFHGTVDIPEGIWCLQAAELRIDGERLNQEFFDTVYVSHMYHKRQAEEYWPVLQADVKVQLNAFSFQFYGVSTVVFDDFTFHVDSFETSFDRVTLSYDKNAFTADTNIWREIRPIPLSVEERIDYEFKDSLFQSLTDSTRLDSIERENNRFVPLNILSGYTYRNRRSGTSFSLGSPLSHIHFNPVQGWNARATVSWAREWRKNEEPHKVQIGGELGYGFTDYEIRGTGFLSYSYNLKHPVIFEIEAGRRLSQINRSQPISPSSNEFANLFFKRHYIRFYDRFFVEARVNKEWETGLTYNGRFEWANRQMVVNESDYSLFYRDSRMYPSNVPDHIDISQEIMLWRNQNALIHQGRLEWTPGIRFIDYPGQRIRVNQSNFTVSAGYLIGAYQEWEEFSFLRLEGEVMYSSQFGIAGRSTIFANAGWTPLQNDLHFIDYKHFNGNRFWLSDAEYTKDFLVLPYYRFSTADPFAQFHWTHDFESFVLNRIPFIRKLNLSLIAKASYLHHEDIGNYQEVSLGINRLGIGILRFLRIDGTLAYRNGSYFDWGLMFGTTISLSDVVPNP